MRKWPVHMLAIAAVMQWGVVQAQDNPEGAAIPPSPEESANQSDQDAAPATGANQEQADQEQENAQPEEPEARPRPRPRSDTAPAPEASNQPTDRPTDLPPATESAPPEPRPQGGESDPGARAPRDMAQDERRDRPEAEFEISPRVQRATANLDIDDATRARYRWNNGEWWFQNEAGVWMYHRDNEWQEFDPTTYQTLSGGRGVPPTFQASPGPVVRGGYSTAPDAARSANSYYYEAPSYRPVPSAGVVRGTGYRYGGRYYDGSPRVSPYGGGYHDGYGYGRSFYNPNTDRYYGSGPYGRGYSVEGDRYRGGVIGSEIGGRIGGRSGAVIGGALGAEAADD